MNFMKTIEMKCVMGELDHPNHNGRIYDSNMMKEAIEKWKENGCKFAELKPDYKNIDFMNPCLSEAVAKVEDVWIEDNKVLGKVELLDTPKGKTLQELIKGGREFKINPRIPVRADVVLVCSRRCDVTLSATLSATGPWELQLRPVGVGRTADFS